MACYASALEPESYEDVMYTLQQKYNGAPR